MSDFRGVPNEVVMVLSTRSVIVRCNKLQQDAKLLYSSLLLYTSSIFICKTVKAASFAGDLQHLRHLLLHNPICVGSVKLLPCGATSLEPNLEKSNASSTCFRLFLQYSICFKYLPIHTLPN